VGLVALVGLGRREAPSRELVVVELVPPPPELAVDPSGLEASAQALQDPPPALHDEIVPPPRPEGAEDDRDNRAAHSAAPRQADGREHATPAPDEGQTGGDRAERASRRDRTALSARVTDGAESSQMPRQRTAHRSTSPQAIRQEPVTGIGDAIASAQPTRSPSAERPDTPPAPAGQGPGAAPGARLAPRVDPHPEIPRTSDRPSRDRGVGPLATEVGARSFDAEARGRAADDQTARAASNERHPGIADFSRAGATGARPSPDGRGPGRAPGAVALATNGTAPAEYGAHTADETHTEVTVETSERVYDRYWQEVQRRVQTVLIFPKRLALRLEQGETVVAFAIRPDGSVGEGPRIVKSSGFQEFDAEAVKAVLRAAPYPRRSDIRRQSLTVTFENPLIR
jgi:TonB family protein